LRNPQSAAKEALSRNNHELKKRRIAVTMPDHRAKANIKYASQLPLFCVV
jgi:hypothetical protein